MLKKLQWKSIPYSRQLLPLGGLLFLVLIAYIANFHHLFSLGRLEIEREHLKQFVQLHPLLSPLIYLGFYIFSVCLIIPDSALLMLIGGVLFKLPLAILYAVIGETLGVLLFFAIFRQLFGANVSWKEHRFLRSTRKHFKRHPASYLLFLRLSHIAPYWFTTVGAAYFKIGYFTLIWTCAVGILPLSYLLTTAGQHLSTFFDQNSVLSMAIIFTTPMKLILLGLGIIALIPIFISYLFTLYSRKKG